MPDKNKTNLGLATVFLLIQRCARVLYVGINALTRLVLPKNMDARLACNQNAAIFDDFWQSRTPTYYTYFKREFDKKGVNIGVLAGFVLLLSGIMNMVANACSLFASPPFKKSSSAVLCAARVISDNSTGSSPEKVFGILQIVVNNKKSKKNK